MSNRNTIETREKLRSAFLQIQRTIDAAPDYIRENPKDGLENILRALEGSLEFAQTVLDQFESGDSEAGREDL